MPELGGINKAGLEDFLNRVPPRVFDNHSQIVAYFGFYLTEELGDGDVTPKKLRACYDAARLPVPANITDTMRKSNAFVRTASGTLLRRETKTRIQDSLITKNQVSISTPPYPPPTLVPDKTRNVVVVHGRDSRLRDGMFQFLRSIGLAPVEWGEAVRRTGRGAPYTGQIVDALFQDAQAIVVLLSPDEQVELRSDLREPNDNDNEGWQPRPNVFIEAGMALARDEAHTILVQIGAVRTASDLLGRHLVHFDGSSAHRHALIERLRTAGCTLSTSGTDWLRIGNFDLSPTIFNGKRRRPR